MIENEFLTDADVEKSLLLAPRTGRAGQVASARDADARAEERAGGGRAGHRDKVEEQDGRVQRLAGAAAAELTPEREPGDGHADRDRERGERLALKAIAVGETRPSWLPIRRGRGGGPTTKALRRRAEQHGHPHTQRGGQLRQPGRVGERAQKGYGKLTQEGAEGGAGVRRDFCGR